jgi:hypothetical protein
MRAKIDKITNWKTQLFFGMAGGISRAWERKEKKLYCSPTRPPSWARATLSKENDLSLSTLSWMESFGNRKALYAPPKRYGVVTLKITKQLLTKSKNYNKKRIKRLKCSWNHPFFFFSRMILSFHVLK